MGNKASKILDPFKKVGNAIKNLADKTANAFTKLGGDIKSTSDKATSQISKVAKSAIDQTRNGFNKFGTTIKNGITDAFTTDFLNNCDEFFSSPEFIQAMRDAGTLVASLDPTGCIGLSIAIVDFSLALSKYTKDKSSDNFKAMILALINLVVSMCAVGITICLGGGGGKVAVLIMNLLVSTAGAGPGLYTDITNYVKDPSVENRNALIISSTAYAVSIGVAVVVSKSGEKPPVSVPVAKSVIRPPIKMPTQP